MLATGLAQHIKDVAGEVGWLEEDVYTFMDVTLCLSSSPATFVARGGPPLVIAKSVHPPRLVDLHAAAAPRLQRQYHQLACYHMLACMARQLPPLVQLEGAGVYLTAHGWSYAASRSESMEHPRFRWWSGAQTFAIDKAEHYLLQNNLPWYDGICYDAAVALVRAGCAVTINGILNK